MGQSRGPVSSPLFNAGTVPELTLGLFENTEIPKTLAQILVEEIDCPPPGQLSGRFVIAWGCIVMESVIGALIHVHGVSRVVRLERGLVSGPSPVDACVERRIVSQQRHFALGDIGGGTL